MRTIRKGAAPRPLAQRHQNPPTTENQAQAAWKNFRGQSRQSVVQQCLQEQYGLCGYSEIDLYNQSPILSSENELLSRDLGLHLEHIEPKSLNPQRTFDHNNLLASAIDDAKARDITSSDVFGGHAKLNWFNSSLLVHPLLPNCRDYFHYESSGRVVPVITLSDQDKARAETTINKLNLNAPVLVLWRKTWLQQAEELIEQLLDDDEALRHFAQSELLPTNGRLRPFHSALRQLFGALGEEICRQYNPAL